MKTSQLLGVWLVEDVFVEDIETQFRTYTSGVHPRGVLMLHESGRMTGLITPRNQNSILSQSDMAKAYKTTLAYSGRFWFARPDKFSTFVDVATYPHWIGTEQVCHYCLTGETLTMHTAPTTGPCGEKLVGSVSFKREKPDFAISEKFGPFTHGA